MAKKRKRSAKGSKTEQHESSAAAEPAADVEPAAIHAPSEELNPYELQRQQLIERNRARLLALGIPMAVAGLQEAVHKAAEPSRSAPSRPRPPPSAPSGPVRRSSRLKEHAEIQQEADEALGEGDRELAMFIIDGECPKCGKILRKGHRQHLAACAGLPEPTEEEKEEQVRQQRERNTNKLLALSLRGLVDFTDEHAKFIVIGSTGTPYPVTLRSGKRTCACVDHRVRKHDCKHIRLVLKQLGIEDNPGSWRQAVEQHFESQLPASTDGANARMTQPASTADEQAVPSSTAEEGKGKTIALKFKTEDTNGNIAANPDSDALPSKRKMPRSMNPAQLQQASSPNRSEALKFT